MSKYFAFLLFSFALIFCSSCGNEVEPFDEESQGYSYAPLEIGKYWIYKSDSLIVKQQGFARDTLSGFIREEVTDTFIDGSDQKAYRIERFFKRNLSDSWGEPRIWTASRSATSYIRTEENLKFVKLVFPPKLNTTWEGNSFIDDLLEVTVDGEVLKPYVGFWDYRVDSIDMTHTNESLVFDNVIKIEHIDDESSIEKRFSEERYAADVGLVYQKIIVLDTQCGQENTAPCVGETFEEFAYKGFTLELQLIEHN